MIWKRLKQYASEQEEKQGPEEKEDIRVPFREQLVMVLTAYVVILLPCFLILIGLYLLVSWLFGLL